ASGIAATLALIDLIALALKVGEKPGERIGGILGDGELDTARRRNLNKIRPSHLLYPTPLASLYNLSDELLIRALRLHLLSHGRNFIRSHVALLEHTQIKVLVQVVLELGIRTAAVGQLPVLPGA